ncbi:hypothetical protein FP2506_16644 [Fulvimarina pelagi HTCC2506]|uniref:Uncharacterized protein n=1 Tax=Fulvimarina pelagi HTCC2506 TaxID=314231 RepID=Q0G2V1_9HYPH|nr:hypothetical protein FP2506_16644 [Fulvimarina pelagi HTCC2506]
MDGTRIQAFDQDIKATAFEQVL